LAAFAFIVRGILDDKPPVENVIAALEHNDRVLQILQVQNLDMSQIR